MARDRLTCPTSRPRSDEDVVAFSTKCYSPANAAVIAGDTDIANIQAPLASLVSSATSSQDAAEPDPIHGVMLDRAAEENGTDRDAVAEDFPGLAPRHVI